MKPSVGQYRQTIERHAHGSLRLSGLDIPFGILSPYFQTTEMREEASDRDIHLSFVPMKIIILNHEVSGTQVNLGVLITDSGETSISSVDFIQFTPTSPFTVENLANEAITAVMGYATGHSLSITESDILDLAAWARDMANISEAPQPAIADAPADAVTDYNTVTTLLGTLTGAVNTANSKQNDIATKLNTLLAELRTLGLIAT